MWKLASHAAWWMMLGGVLSTAMLGAAVRLVLPAQRPAEEWTRGGPPAPVTQLRVDRRHDLRSTARLAASDR